MGCHAFVVGRFKVVLCYEGKKAALRCRISGDLNSVQAAFWGKVVVILSLGVIDFCRLSVIKGL